MKTLSITTLAVLGGIGAVLAVVAASLVPGLAGQDSMLLGVGAGLVVLLLSAAPALALAARARGCARRISATAEDIALGRYTASFTEGGECELGQA